MSRFDWISSSESPVGYPMDDQIVELVAKVGTLKTNLGDSGAGLPVGGDVRQHGQEVERAELALDIGAGTAPRCRARSALAALVWILCCHRYDVRKIAPPFKQFRLTTVMHTEPKSEGYRPHLKQWISPN